MFFVFIVLGEYAWFAFLAGLATGIYYLGRLIEQELFAIIPGTVPPMGGLM